MEIRQRAIELRLAGYTLREIGQQLDVSHQIISDWSDTEEANQAATARQQRIVTAHQDLHLEAAGRLSERLPSMEDKELVRAFAATAQANHGDLRIIQDERKTSSLIDAIRRQLLATKQPHELSAMLQDQPTTSEHPT